jgi:hypothetical protein
MNSIEQSPSWEGDSHSVGQDIPRLLWIPKVHCCAHKNPTLDLSWYNLIQSISMHTFLKTHFNIVLRMSKIYIRLQMHEIESS